MSGFYRPPYENDFGEPKPSFTPRLRTGRGNTNARFDDQTVPSSAVGSKRSRAHYETPPPQQQQEPTFIEPQLLTGDDFAAKYGGKVRTRTRTQSNLTPTPRTRKGPPAKKRKTSNTATVPGANDDGSDVFEYLRWKLEQDIENSRLALVQQMWQGDLPVFGRGNPDSDIMVLGEAPGNEEIRSGLPFVGPSGRLVEELFNEFGLETERDAFVTNVVKLFPYTQGVGRDGKPSRFARRPTIAEIQSHKQYLIDQIVQQKPKVIFCFGNVPANVMSCGLVLERISSSKSGDLDTLLWGKITQMQGNPRVIYIKGVEHGIHVVPLVHPAYMLHREKTPSEVKLIRLAWSKAFQEGLQLRHQPTAAFPKPLLLDDLNSGWNKEMEPDFKWDKSDQIFWERPNLPPADYLTCPEKDLSSKIAFQLDTLDYQKSDNTYIAFGRTSEGYSIRVNIEGFEPKFYTQIPRKFNFTSKDHKKRKYATLGKSLSAMRAEMATFLPSDLQVKLTFEKHRDHYAGWRDHTKQLPYYARYTVKAHEDIARLLDLIRANWDKENYEYRKNPKGAPIPQNAPLVFYHTDSKPEHNFTYDTKILACSWVEIERDNLHPLWTGSERGKESIRKENPVDLEVFTHVKHMIQHYPTDPKWAHHAYSRILALDIECLSKNFSFPVANKDPVITICAQLQIQDDKLVIDPNTGKAAANEDFCFTLRRCAPPEKDLRNCKLFQFDSEKELLCAFFTFLLQCDPDMIAGHNVKKFDLKYIIDRADALGLTEKDGWTHFGRIAGHQTTYREKKFQSRAHGERVNLIIDCPGRAIIDTLEIYLREKKLASYTLQYISTKFLGFTKNDMPYVAIPGYFWGSPEANRKLVEYCHKDALLVMMLLNKGKWIITLKEMSRENGTIFPDASNIEGQQIKGYSAFRHKNARYGDRSIVRTHERPVGYNYNAGNNNNTSQPEPEDIEVVEETYTIHGCSGEDDDDSDDDGDYGDDGVVPTGEDGDGDGDDDGGDSEEEPQVVLPPPPQKRGRKLPDVTKAPVYGSGKGKQTLISSMFSKNDRKATVAPPPPSSPFPPPDTGPGFDTPPNEHTRVKPLKETNLGPAPAIAKNTLSRSELRRKKRLEAKIAEKKASEQRKGTAAQNQKAAAVKKARYAGAEVLEPIRGLHKRPNICGDFASLYPSIMIRHNLCHSTKLYGCQLHKHGFTAKDVEEAVKGKSERLHCPPEVFVHKGCKTCGSTPKPVYFVHHLYAATFYESDLKWLQEEYALFGEDFSELIKDTGTRGLHPRKWRNHKFSSDEEREEKFEKVYIFKDTDRGLGLLPLTLTGFLLSRGIAKKQRDTHPVGSPMYDVLEGRQFVLKILANSAYGATGVEFGRLADFHIGASVTGYGRVFIIGTRDRALAYYTSGPWADLTGGDVSESRCNGGDTDSWFFQAAFVDTVEQAMEFGYRCVDYQNTHFVKPICLGFEKVMWPFMVIAKKRYTCNLFAGEFNYFVFERKRWIELHVPQDRWEEIFALKNWHRGGSDDTKVEGPLFSGKYSEESWWKTVPGKTPTGEVIPPQTPKKWGDLIYPEQARRRAQTDEQWIADYLKPRYEGEFFHTPDYGVWSSKGVEAVRRDACPFLSSIQQQYFKMVLIEGRIVDAILFLYENILALIEGRVLESDLIMSKQISKQHYSSYTQPHTYLAKKKADRGDKVPEVGERVPYYIIMPRRNFTTTDPRTGKKVFMKEEKTYMRSEDPDVVLSKSLKIDTYWYVMNQCMKPLLRVLDPVIENAKDILFKFDLSTLEKSRYVKPREETSALLKHTKRVDTCQLCERKYFSDHSSTDVKICDSCASTQNYKHLKAMREKSSKKLETASVMYEKQMDTCRKCTNTYEAPCNNFLCGQYPARKKLEVAKNSCTKELQDIEDLVAPIVSRAREEKKSKLLQASSRPLVCKRKRSNSQDGDANSDATPAVVITKRARVAKDFSNLVDGLTLLRKRSRATSQEDDLLKPPKCAKI